jgi:preprotein translocase subunit SecE
MAETDNPGAEIPGSGRLAGRSQGEAKHRASTQSGRIAQLGQFIRDVRAELKRVSWPTAKEVKNTTIITLIAVVFFAVYLFSVDRVWSFLLTQLNALLNWLTGY